MLQKMKVVKAFRDH